MIPRPSDHKVLVGKRGPACKRGSGCWALPGGHIDVGESLVDGLIREVFEETGLFVRPSLDLGRPPFVTTTPFAITDHLGEENHLSLWYLVKLNPHHTFRRVFEDEFEAAEPEKCEGWKWLSMQEIAQIPGVDDKNNKSDSQYHWLPLDVFRATLPKELFGEF